MLEAGFAVASIYSRLALETGLAAIAEEIEDAFRWIRSRGPPSPEPTGTEWWS